EIKFKNMYLNTLIKQGNIEYETGNLISAKSYFAKALTLSGDDEDLKQKLELIKNSLGETPVKKAETVGPAAGNETSPVPAEKAQGSTTESTLFQEKQSYTSKAAQPETGGNTGQPALKAAETTAAASQPVQTSGSGVVQLPFDINKFIEQQKDENKRILNAIINSQKDARESLIAENKRIVDKIIEVQKGERDNLFNHIKEITRSQFEDRRFFSRSLLEIIGAGILIVLLILFGIMLIIKRLAKVVSSTISRPIRTIGSSTSSPLGIISDMDTAKYLTDDRFSDLETARRLEELYNKLAGGELSFDAVQEYISELNRDVKSDILNLIEERISTKKDINTENTYKILLPFVTDGEYEIQASSKDLLNKLIHTTTKEVSLATAPRENVIMEDPLSYASLYNMALLADNKTGRYLHSSSVAEFSYEIALQLKNPDIDPEQIYKAGLAHDMGYLEIDDSIMKKNTPLTGEEFELIKTHPARGVKLLGNVKELPTFLYNCIMFHHEKLNGKGYPKGLTDGEIPLEAKIIAAADFFSASTSARPYREAKSLSICFSLMEEAAGQTLDADLVDILIRIVKDRTNLR
ncbi:MAG: HD domain-containing protein, partial [Spirochaetes bacterium]|nr:HD domain-containing protein [Spirochaetota bacterium]